ncbi:hypothetical protein V6N11_079938 [Hibiscus sabdariffa]|uniref:Uncharacterized protein n=1 Tax=Hibiscus sabdariffa TaxID=183260 RepID=A0ABR2RX69_9ROSI
MDVNPQHTSSQAIDTNAALAPIVSINSPQEDTLLPAGSCAAVDSRPTSLLGVEPSRALNGLSDSPYARSPMLTAGSDSFDVVSSPQQLDGDRLSAIEQSHVLFVGPSSSIGVLPDSLGVHVD